MVAMVTAQEVSVPAGDGARLPGNLAVPDRAPGVVVFAHGSGSSRHSPRNRAVADALHGAGLATLLFDLLTAEEEQRDALTGELRFDVDLLAARLTATVDWLVAEHAELATGLGLFGASTGAAAALQTAAERPEPVRAVVSRGGRPDLAASALPRVQAPVLLVVGGFDEPVLKLNREAAEALAAPHRLHIVPGASHLFEESGALEQVSEVAAQWFSEHLGFSERLGGRS